METHTIYANNKDLFDVEQEIKGFIKSHKGKLDDDERDLLGKLLDQRARAISDVLGFTVGSVAPSSTLNK